MDKETTKEDPPVKWYQARYCRNVCLTVLIFLAFYLLILLQPSISRIVNFTISVLFPFLLSLIIYYFVRPIVQVLRKKVSIYLAIAIVYLMLLAFFAFIGIFIYPHVMDQVRLLKTIDFESVIENSYKSLVLFKHFHIEVISEQELKAYLGEFLNNSYAVFLNNIFGFMTSLADFIFDLVIIPLILFYLLKDDKAIYAAFCRWIPSSYSQKVESFLTDVDTTLMNFITARVTISACVSFLLFVGFLIIGINYSYILAIVSFIFYIIPSVGGMLASILPLIVGFSMSLSMGIETIFIVMIAAGIEGVCLSPAIMGRSLTIHPLTVILILIAAGYLFGIAGLLLVTPAFALLKVLTFHLYNYTSEKELE